MLLSIVSVVAWLGIVATIAGRADACNTVGFCASRTALVAAVDSYTAGAPDPDLPPIEDWDVSAVTDMRYVFHQAASFNSDLSAWDVGAVTDMTFMFTSATSFCQNISGWDVGTVTSMRYMFHRAVSFNSDLSGWDVGSVTSMDSMFAEAASFNSDLSGGWDVGAVTDMRNMFYYATSFNGDLSGGWDVGSVIQIAGMFHDAVAFNGDISGWDVGSFTNMQLMFRHAASFNGDLSGWDVGSVTDVGNMFNTATSFNGDLSSWDVGGVTDMASMFHGAIGFNRDLSRWDVCRPGFCLQDTTSFSGATSFDLGCSPFRHAGVVFGSCPVGTLSCGVGTREEGDVCVPDCDNLARRSISCVHCPTSEPTSSPTSYPTIDAPASATSVIEITVSGSLAMLTQDDRDGLAAEVIRLLAEAAVAAGSTAVITSETATTTFHEVEGSIVVAVEFRNNNGVTQAASRAIGEEMRARNQVITLNGVSYTVVAVSSTVKTNNDTDAALSDSTADERAKYAIIVLVLAFVVFGAAGFGLKFWRAHRSKDMVQEVDEPSMQSQPPELTVMEHVADIIRTSPDQRQPTRSEREPSSDGERPFSI